MPSANRPQRHIASAPVESSYPISTDLEYRLLKAERVVAAGMGRTTSLSSSRVVFESDRELPVGLLIEMAVAWPARLENKVRLRLHILGRTVRASQKLIAIDILRHEFKTMAAGDDGRNPVLSAPVPRVMAASASVSVEAIGDKFREPSAQAELGMLAKAGKTS